MRLRYFKFFGDITPRAAASHFNWTLRSDAGLSSQLTASHLTLQIPPIDLDIHPFEQGVITAQEIADRYALILSLLGERPYRIELTSWQEFNPENNMMTTAGNILQEEERVEQVRTSSDPLIIPFHLLDKAPGLRNALQDFRQALEQPGDVLVYLWRAVESIHVAVVSHLSSLSRDFSVTEAALRLEAGSIKTLYNRANDGTLAQRHVGINRLVISNDERGGHLDFVRRVITAYADFSQRQASNV